MPDEPIASPGHFLVVEDDHGNAQTLMRLLRRFRATDVADSVWEARHVLFARKRWTGVVVDIGLPDGSGLDVASHVRKHFPLLPVLMLTGRNDRVAINRAHELRAEYVVKPATEADLFGFIRRAVAFERVPDERLSWLIEELARNCELTPRETDVVAAVMANTPRERLLEQFQVTGNTLKSLVRHILRKTGHDSLDDLAKSLLYGALSGGETTQPFDLSG
jgi:FixJ family two-component response regulator